MLVRHDTDCVVLATVVMGESSVAAAKIALEKMAAPLAGVKVVKASATIVVMGSKRMVDSIDNYAESTMLNCLRRLSLPMLIITPNVNKGKGRRRSMQLTTGPLPPAPTPESTQAAYARRKKTDCGGTVGYPLREERIVVKAVPPALEENHIQLVVPG
eukprot:gene23966-9538_t